MKFRIKIRNYDINQHGKCCNYNLPFIEKVVNKKELIAFNPTSIYNTKSSKQLVEEMLVTFEYCKQNNFPLKSELFCGQVWLEVSPF